MIKVGIFSGHLKCLAIISYILWAYGYCVVLWYIFRRFGILYEEQYGNHDFFHKHETEFFSFFTFFGGGDSGKRRIRPTKALSFAHAAAPSLCCSVLLSDENEPKISRPQILSFLSLSLLYTFLFLSFYHSLF
jgi:hypothetical protein